MAVDDAEGASPQTRILKNPGMASKPQLPTLDYSLELDGAGHATAFPLHLGPFKGETRETVPEAVRLKVPANAKPGDEVAALFDIFGERRELVVLNKAHDSTVDDEPFLPHPYTPLFIGEARSVPTNRRGIAAAVDAYLHRVVVEVGRTGSVRVSAFQLDCLYHKPGPNGLKYLEFESIGPISLARRPRKIRPSGEYLAMDAEEAAEAIAADFEQTVNKGAKRLALISSTDDPRLKEVPLAFLSGSEGQLQERIHDITAAYAQGAIYGGAGAWGFPMDVLALMDGPGSRRRPCDNLRFWCQQRQYSLGFSEISWSDQRAAKAAFQAAFSENAGAGQDVLPRSFGDPTSVDLAEWVRIPAKVRATVEPQTAHERLEALERLESLLDRRAKH